MVQFAGSDPIHPKFIGESNPDGVLGLSSLSGVPAAKADPTPAPIVRAPAKPLVMTTIPQAGWGGGLGGMHEILNGFPQSNSQAQGLPIPQQAHFRPLGTKPQRNFNAYAQAQMANAIQPRRG